MSIKLRTSFYRNIGYGALTRLMQSFVGFFIITYVIKTVGIEDWGILTVSVSIVSLLSVLQVSLSGSTGKRLTDFIIKKDLLEYNKYLSGTFIVCFVIILLISSAVLIYYFYFLEGFDFNGSNSKLQSIFLLTGLNSIIQVLSLPGLAVLQSINRIDINSKITTVGFVIRAILVFLVFNVNKSIVVYSILLSIEMTINFLSMTYWIYRKSELNLVFTFKNIKSDYLLNILKFNSLNFINSLNYLFFIQLPAIVVAKKYGMTYSGYYGIGIQLNTLIRGVSNILMSSMTPVFNILKAQENISKLRQFLKLSNIIFSILGLGIISISFFLIETIVSFWLGTTSIELIRFLKVFLIFTAIGVTFIPSAILIITIEKLKSTTFFGLFLALSASMIVYFLPKSVDEYIWVPSIVSGLFFLYNLHRYYISNKFISVPFRVIKNNLAMICLVLASFSLILSFNFYSPVINFIIANIIMITIVFLIEKMEFFSDLYTLIKKNK